MWGNNRTDLGRKGMLPMDWGRAGRLTGALGGRRAVAPCGAVGGGCSGSGINRGSCSKGACNQYCRLYAFKGLAGRLGPIGVLTSMLAIMAGVATGWQLHMQDAPLAKHAFDSH